MIRNAAIAVLSISIVGCTLRSNDSEQNSLLKLELSGVKSQIEAHEASQLKLEERVASLELTNISRDTAYLDPAGGSGYQYVTSNVAPVLVSFRDASPAGDGTKVQLQIGNITSATFSGAEITAAYNKRAPDDVAQMGNWAASKRAVTAKVVAEIEAGAWTNVEVSLPGIKPQDLGYLAVSLKFDTVALRKAR